MYRVNDDKRCLASCEIIYNSLIELIGEGKTLYTINVSELSRRSTVSRGTFYKHFDAIEDVIIWKCDKKIQESCRIPYLRRNNRLFVVNFFEYWMQEQDFIDVLVKVGRVDYLLYSLQRTLGGAAGVLFEGINFATSTKGYLINIWSVIIWAILQTWIIRGRTETAEYLANIALHNLPDIYSNKQAQNFDEMVRQAATLGIQLSKESTPPPSLDIARRKPLPIGTLLRHSQRPGAMHLASS